MLFLRLLLVACFSCTLCAGDPPIVGPAPWIPRNLDDWAALGDEAKAYAKTHNADKRRALEQWAGTRFHWHKPSLWSCDTLAPQVFDLPSADYACPLLQRQIH